MTSDTQIKSSFWPDYFSYRGRISKKELYARLRQIIIIAFGVNFIFMALIIVASQFLNFDDAFALHRNFALGPYPIFFLAMISLGSLFVRRGHDRNRSGWQVYVWMGWMAYFTLGSLYAWSMGDPLFCSFAPAKVCSTSAFVIVRYLLDFVMIVLNIMLIVFVIECHSEGSVAGAERYGDDPEDR